MSGISTHLERLKGTQVLCIGDVMLDHFVFGEVSRISPEAPIPVLRIEQTQTMLGGAGNAVRNLAAIGSRVRFVSVIGDDNTGHEVERLCGTVSGVTHALFRVPDRVTSTKTRFVAHGQQLLRADNETDEPVGADVFEHALADVSATLPYSGALLLCDYAKGILTGDRASRVIAEAWRQRCPVIVDPKGSDFRRYAGATLLKPNLRELAVATGMPVANELNQIEAGNRVLEVTGAEYLLLTRGSEGMLLVPRSGRPAAFPSQAREVYDVTGAGDTVAAIMTAAIAAGLAMEDAVHIANLAAGIVVGKIGTAVVEAEEILRLTPADAADVVSPASFADAIAQVRSWRAAGLRVGFARGSVESLTADIVHQLTRIRSSCDRLVVAIDSQGERAQEQAWLVASISAVDLAVVSSASESTELQDAATAPHQSAAQPAAGS